MGRVRAALSVLDYVTEGAAFGGLVLGLLTAWRTFLDNRVRLRVTAYLKKEPGFAKGFTKYGEEFVVVGVTNMSKFPVALAAVALVLRDGEERWVSQGSGTIEPRRRKELIYPLLEKKRTDALGNVVPENVLSCRVRTECGLELVKPVSSLTR